MGVIVVGVNHRTAALDLRERLNYRPADAAQLLASLLQAGAREAVALSTCNRTEVYLVEGERELANDVIAHFDTRLDGAASQVSYVRRDRDAVAHLYRVTAGLDSMVIGEAQIHGQVRDAWEASREHSGAVLNRLFQSSLQVAGRVRNETGVGRGVASVSSAAVQLAKQIFGSLSGARAMVLGAGEMADLALESLARDGVKAAIVANRTYERATELAERYGARAIHYDECWRELAEVDLLLCSTSSPHPVVTVERVAPALAARGDRPLCILDIAMPRDVHPDVGRLGNVFLYDLDDLQAVVASTLERRRSELPEIEALIGAEVERYWQWVAGLAAVPVLIHLRSRLDQMRERELADAMRRMPSLNDSQREGVEQLSRSLLAKFLHEPSVRLRAAAANGRGLGVVDTMQYLFALDEPEMNDTPEDE
ncbi:MAG: Glutamyl-tRNA reductase [Gemmatimonadetes bacterium]|nr:Glutamyl-tRNA reductase [Gemmatimonadota bacterium]